MRLLYDNIYIYIYMLDILMMGKTTEKAVVMLCYVNVEGHLYRWSSSCLISYMTMVKLL